MTHCCRHARCDLALFDGRTCYGVLCSTTHVCQLHSTPTHQSPLRAAFLSNGFGRPSNKAASLRVAKQGALRSSGFRRASRGHFSKSTTVTRPVLRKSDVDSDSVTMETNIRKNSDGNFCGCDSLDKTSIGSSISCPVFLQTSL